MFWTRLLSGIVLLAIALATFSFGNSDTLAVKEIQERKRKWQDI